MDGNVTHIRETIIYLKDAEHGITADDGFDISGSGHRTFINCWAMSTEKYASMDIEGNGFKCTGAQSRYYFPQYLTDTTLVRYIGCLAAFCHASGFANNVNNNGDRLYSK